MHFIKSFFFFLHKMCMKQLILFVQVYWIFLCIYATILDPSLKRHDNLLASIVCPQTCEIWVLYSYPLMRSLTSLCWFCSIAVIVPDIIYIYFITKLIARQTCFFCCSTCVSRTMWWLFGMGLVWTIPMAVLYLDSYFQHSRFLFSKSNYRYSFLVKKFFSSKHIPSKTHSYMHATGNHVYILMVTFLKFHDHILNSFLMSIVT